jgi:short-subunit dehydrogenase
MARTALITGASAGIGAEFARELARDGFDLVLVARRKDRLDKLAAELKSEFGITTCSLAFDLGDPSAPGNIAAELQRQKITIDMLVNNAGSGIAKTFKDADWHMHAQLIQVQVTAAAQLTHLLLPSMIERGYGRIVHLASLAGLLPGAPTSTLYAAAKSFLVKFSESLSAELQGTGVHVCAVCPGFTLTEFHDVMGTRGVVSKLPSFMWLDARSVARQGIDAVMRDETVFVPGPINRLVAGFMRHLTPGRARQLMRSRAKHYRAVPSASDPA